mmetsp:Transcript_9772/g.20276  ORF Transcript_9772/g.20276 Transcript_9772/m.20276 type:complete len:307 (-) Transcript_9772:17-937(-)
MGSTIPTVIIDYHSNSNTCPHRSNRARDLQQDKMAEAKRCYSNLDAVSRNSDEVKFFMKQALRVAKSALDIGEVPVGCVIVLSETTPKLNKLNCITPTSSSTSNEMVYIGSPSVIVSHGANQVNATRDATRHAEIVAIDRMLTGARSSDQMKLPVDTICKSAHGKIPENYSTGLPHENDKWINVPACEDHWKNNFGWGSGMVFDKSVFPKCDLYVTCEPCIMCAAALSMVGIRRVFFGCKNDRFGGCGSLLQLHKPDAVPSSQHFGFEVVGGVLEEESIRLLRSFYDRENFHAPDHKRKRKNAEES